MQAIILQCKPRARFHFGNVAPDSNTSLNTTSPWLPSDTLFSALVNIHAEMHTEKETQAFIGHFERRDIVVSSGFYCLELAGKWIFFLPKPAHFALRVRENFKTFKKVKLISKTVWEQGRPFEEWEQHCVFLQNGEVVVAKSELEGIVAEEKAKDIRLFKEWDSPRVKIHAPTREDAYFQLSTVSIADNREILPAESRVHLYFLLETSEGFDQTAELMTAIRMLPDRGIGGERSTGCGQLSGIREDVPFEAPRIAQGTFCSVALTLPDPSQLGAFQCYDVETRGGRPYGSGDKKFNFARMLSEGAVAQERIRGRLVKIGTNEGHEVKRCGQPFYLETQSIQATT